MKTEKKVFCVVTDVFVILLLHIEIKQFKKKLLVYIISF